MVYNDGTIYDGLWHNNRKHGQGVLHLPADSFLMKYRYFVRLVNSRVLDIMESGTRTQSKGRE